MQETQENNLKDKKSYEERRKQHKRRIKTLLIKASFMAMLFVVSTYAWFTSQKDITLSNIRGTVEVVENMEISLDAKNWYQQIDLTEAEILFGAAQLSRDEALGETESDTKSTALTILPEIMFPVSGVGEITSKTLLPLYTGQASSTSLKEIVKCEEKGTDANGKDAPVDNGYIAFDMYIKNTSRDNEDDVLQLNVNSVAQVLTESIEKTITDVTGNRVQRTYTGNADSGLQNTVRVGLAMYNGGITSTATQKEILESTKEATIKDLAIWEPNAYDHVESIVVNNNKLINGTSTEKIPFTENQAVDTYAITEDAVGETISNVYDITEVGLGLQGTFKTDNVKDGDGNVVDYRIYTETAKPLDIKNISGDDFVIPSNEVTRFRVYVWIEGQDVDCINIASLGGGIELDLGLTKDNEIGDGDGSRLLASVDYDLSEITNGEVTATITANREIELPDGWSYGEVASYAVASMETIQLATENEVSNNVISKVFTENTKEYVTIEDGIGTATVVRVEIEEFDEEAESTYTVTYKNSDGTHTYYEETVESGNAATYSVEPNDDPALTDELLFMFWATTPGGNTKADLTNITSDITVYSYFSRCFVAGTKVLTETGLKNIEDIVVGEKVYTLNLDNNQRELKEVRKTMQSYTKETYKITIGEIMVETTPRHEFYIVDKGWIRAYEIEVGDMVVAQDNTKLIINEIENIMYEEMIPVYNLEIDGNHNYLVTELEILVHNADSPSL